MHLYIIRYSEIFLKGGNRKIFEKALKDNIKRKLRLEKNKNSLSRVRNRMLLRTENPADLRRVFGIISYSEATHCNAKEIEKEAVRIFNPQKKFRITTKRMDKTKGPSSMEMNRRVGQLIKDKSGAEVDLTGFEEELGIEVAGEDAYLFKKTVRCHGGLPVGVEGRVCADIKDEKDELAAILMMRRGCDITCEPTTLLKKYACGRPFKGECQARISTEKPKKHAGLVLYPLLGFQENEVRTLMGVFR